ncbi:hypothetical protein [Methyloceanibacter superfactus]|nr:hypothetical protein [Methyloceanibacter superfactus]
MAALSVLMALGIVLAVMPMLAALFLKEGGSKYLADGRARNGVALLDNAAATISAAVAKWPKIIAVAGVALTALFGLAYLQLEPRYRLSDMLPDQGTAATVLDRIEERLGGLFPLSVMVEWPEGLEPQSKAVREIIQEVHETLERHSAISKVNSLHDLQRWAESGGLPPDEAARALTRLRRPWSYRAT